jgi:hypothetical protein
MASKVPVTRHSQNVSKISSVPPGQAPVYLILDALDECPNTSDTPTPREKVLRLVEDLVDLQLPNLRICLTSRPEVDIKGSKPSSIL